MTAKRCVVLLSGGLDSATVLGLARAEGLECFALSVDYGQRHSCELDCARRQVQLLGAAQHLVLKMDLRPIGGSSLTTDQPVPAAEPERGSIPSTYVPARNTIFLSLALGWAEVLGAQRIDVGVNAVDYSGYPDCRPEFIEAFQRLANRATAAAVEGGKGVRIHAPLLHWRKAEIIRRGLACGVDFGETTSCYAPTGEGRPCGRCDSCAIRQAAFAELGRADPRNAP